jgi:glutathione S-transferase
MTAELAIGQRSYSSWSLRPWLVVEHLGLPVRSRDITMYAPDFLDRLADFAPARTVPALRCDDGSVVLESLAIIEELASRFPAAGVWPADPVARARARSLAAEMHAGFIALRAACPHNLRHAYAGFAVTAEVQADLDRIERIWSLALAAHGGPWLCGAWSAADAMFAPVAMRIATYGLLVGPAAAGYVAQWLADPALRRWRAQGLAAEPPIPLYELDLPSRPWPGPEPLPARAVEGGRAENAACPYSGRPVSHVLELDGRRWGFCNALCRDKTVLDPAAWPQFMAMIA